MARKSKGRFKMKGHSIPGVKGFKGNSQSDGRASSSPYQMKDSPNKNIFKTIGQGLLGKGKMGFMNPAMWAGRGIKNLVDKDPTTGTVFNAGATPEEMAAQKQQMAQAHADASGGIGAAQGTSSRGLDPKALAGNFLQVDRSGLPMKMDNTKLKKTVGGRLGGNIYDSSALKQESNVQAYHRKNKQYVDKDKTVPLDPGYEDIDKIQKIQREGLTPHSQEFHKRAKKNVEKKESKRGVKPKKN